MPIEKADEVPKGPAISDRKARANAENARRSTGPQTFDGKQRASMNALKHGGFANRSVAIPRGTFAEDPAELDCFMEAIIDSLAPRDEDELGVARRIAWYQVRAVRLSILEAESLGVPDPIAPGEGASPTREHLAAALICAQRFARWLGNGDVAGVNFGYILKRLRTRAEGYATCGREVETEPEEISAGSKQSRVAWYIEHHFECRAEAVAWSLELVKERTFAINAIDRKHHKSAVDALLEIDRVSVISQRNSRELELARREYRYLRERLPDRIVLRPSRNEPTGTEKGGER